MLQRCQEEMICQELALIKELEKLEEEDKLKQQQSKLVPAVSSLYVLSNYLVLILVLISYRDNPVSGFNQSTVGFSQKDLATQGAASKTLLLGPITLLGSQLVPKYFLKIDSPSILLNSIVYLRLSYLPIFLLLYRYIY